jgi:putative acetyltransferase
MKDFFSFSQKNISGIFVCMIIAATPQHYPLLIGLWEQSVRATHHFLPEDYLQAIKKLLPSILPTIPTFVFLSKDKDIAGFIGVADQKIEMLFVRPDKMKQGIGRSLTGFAIQQRRARTVDVNEQNEEAVNFYLHLGFVKKGRSVKDGLGKPFPLLHMELVELK